MNSMISTAKPIREICTTTLAQDAFNLYHTVIGDVTQKIKRDLKDMGKTNSEVNFVTNLLKSTWKRALDQSHCIDHENLTGINLNDIARNIGQDRKSKRQKVNHNEEEGEFVAPKLHSGNSSLILEKRIPNFSKLSNPYIDSEDFSDVKSLSVSFSGLPSPIKKYEYRYGVNSEPDVLEGGGTRLGTALHDNAMSPRKYKKTLEKPLGSDDDDTDEDGEEPTDLVVCSYSRVMKKKGDWNMDLKNGIIHLAGKDYAFKAARGGHLRW